MALHLTLTELERLALIVRKSNNPNSCSLEMIINDEIEHEKSALMDRYRRLTSE